MTDPDDYRDLTVTATMTETTARYKFGDRVEMIAASHDNPHKYGFFIRKGRSAAFTNGGPYVELTDGKGNVWRTPPDNVRPAPATPPAPTAAPSPAPQEVLTAEELRALLRDPRYWRDRNPAVIAQIEANWKRLYGSPVEAMTDERGVSKLCMDLLKAMHEAPTMEAGYEMLADFTEHAGLGTPVPLRSATPAAGEALEETAKRIMWAIERNGPYNAGTADGRWHSMPKESRDRCLRAALAAARKE